MIEYPIEDDPLWYKDAVIYQVHIRAFFDSNDDGIGDFRGLASKLDYLRDLGVTAIWVLPFYPSPLRDDGYDIADYTRVHPDYGSLADFRLFLRKAHRRGLRVITELVLNHTSDQHPWFQRARRSPPGSAWRDFYVWSDTPDRFKGTRIIFKDFESSNWSWDPLAKAYYWHRFYHHQPDLNFDHPEVWKTMIRAIDFWLGMGVDGLRLDAVPYLFEREGTNCENLPETHQALKRLRHHIDTHHKNRMLLAEANQWPEDAALYFADGDECHMAFHFPVMPRMFMALRMEDRYPIIDILTQTPTIPETCQWAIFLRNHDELTLEMVTDEERDYMYRVYAHDERARINLGIRRRLSPLLGNDRRRIELMKGLLLSLPGTPVIYYGDEIGMGDNIYLGDRNGVRTPMQWSGDRNAGFSRASAQRLYLPVIVEPDSHYEAVNVETQLNNPHSLLWWTRRVIAMRRRYRALSRGDIEFLFPENPKVLAFIRRHQHERILMVANLSRHAQHIEVDLSGLKGLVPVELFGGNRFPPITEAPYLLTLGPHGFYWFSLEMAEEEAEAVGAPVRVAPEIKVKGSWEEILKPDNRRSLESVLPRYLKGRRWFGGKARSIKSAGLTDTILVRTDGASYCLALVQVDYSEGEPETYVLPLGFISGPETEKAAEDSPQDVIAFLATTQGRGILHECLGEASFSDALLTAIARRRHFKGTAGEIVAAYEKGFRRMRGPAADHLEPTLLRGEQSNSSILFGDRMILKLFRRAEGGVNPDLEIGSFLTQKSKFTQLPPVGGYLEYRPRRGQRVTLGILQGFVANEGDAWRYTVDSLGRFFEQVAAVRPETEHVAPPREPLLELVSREVPESAQHWIGVYLESSRLLGQRTADLHVALTSETQDPAFTPEPFTPFYQRSLYQSMRNQTSQTFELLRRRISTLAAEEERAAGQEVLEREKDILARFARIRDRTITAMRARVHGDYHLGQVLYTGRDFFIIDFEGEPARPLSARKIKRSPLRDVAGMLRSFQYASFAALHEQVRRGLIVKEDLPLLEPWAQCWAAWVSAVFLRTYLNQVAEGGFLPAQRGELRVLLDAYLLEKALYELTYELNNRPDWVRLPLRGILDLLGSGS